MKELNENSKLNGLYDIYKVIWNSEKDKIDGYKLFVFQEYGNQVPTLKELLNIATERGYKGGTLIVIAEAPTYGKVIQYENYGDIWLDYGSTLGYA